MDESVSLCGLFLKVILLFPEKMYEFLDHGVSESSTIVIVSTRGGITRANATPRQLLPVSSMSVLHLLQRPLIRGAWRIQGE